MPQFPQCPSFAGGCSLHPFFHPKICSRQAGPILVTLGWGHGEGYVTLSHPSCSHATQCHHPGDQLWSLPCPSTTGYIEIKIIGLLLTY